MLKHTYLRRILSPHASNEIVNLPKPNSPTSACTISGDQYHSSIKDFCEFIYKNGTTGFQTPSGNLYINNVNIGPYEYELYYGGYTVSTSNSQGSSSEDVSYFLVTNGLTVGGSINVGPNNANKSKRLFVIYSFQTIGSTNGIGSFINRAPANAFTGNIRIINSTIGDSPSTRVMKFPMLTTPYLAGGTSTFFSSSSYAVAGGGNGNPTSPNATSDNLYPGSGGGGAGGSVSSTATQADPGRYASSIGGGGGGGSAIDDANYISSIVSHKGGDARNPVIFKGDPIYSAAGGSGNPDGNSIPNSGGDTLNVGGTPGGTIIIFAMGNIATTLNITTAGSGSPYYNTANSTGGGASGGGPIFVMAPNASSTTTSTIPGVGVRSGGSGGYGIAVKTNSAGFGPHRWII